MSDYFARLRKTSKEKLFNLHVLQRSILYHKRNSNEMTSSYLQSSPCLQHERCLQKDQQQSKQDFVTITAVCVPSSFNPYLIYLCGVIMGLQLGKYLAKPSAMCVLIHMCTHTSNLPVHIVKKYAHTSALALLFFILVINVFQI